MFSKENDILPFTYDPYYEDNQDWAASLAAANDLVEQSTPNFLADAQDETDTPEVVTTHQSEHITEEGVSVGSGNSSPDAANGFSSSEASISPDDLPIDPALEPDVQGPPQPYNNQTGQRPSRQVNGQTAQEPRQTANSPMTFTDEQEDVSVPEIRPASQVYPDPTIYSGGPPPYGNWSDWLPNNQSYPLSVQDPLAAGQSNAGQYPLPPPWVFTNEGYVGAFHRQQLQAAMAANGFASQRLSQRPQAYDMSSVVAEQGDDIEYVSVSGDVFRGANVRFNPNRGFFMPLTQRRRDKSSKRTGPRPGTRDEQLFEMCKWRRGDKAVDSECLGLNVYGTNYDCPSDWELPDGLGRILYNNHGCMPDGTSLSARQIRAYIDSNPRSLRLMVANAPSQAIHRIMAKECIWECCPNSKRNLRQGFHQIIFDEYPEQTDLGERDPFRIAGRMHLWCYEQCFDIVEDFKAGIVKAETRRLRREEKNAMALDRDCNSAVMRETYEPWFKYHIEHSNGPLSCPRPFEQSLAHALTMHHLLNQANQRQKVRDKRNSLFVGPKKSLDVHRGNLLLYQQHDDNVSFEYQSRDSRPENIFQPSAMISGYRLPDHFGKNATGRGYLLDPSVATSKPRATRRGKKRSRKDMTAQDASEGGLDADADNDGASTRASKRTRTAASPNSPRHTRNTRSNATVNGLVFPSLPN